MTNKILFIRKRETHPAFKTLYDNPPKNLSFQFKERYYEDNFKKIEIRNKGSNDKKSQSHSIKLIIIDLLKRFYECFFRILKLPPITPIISFKKNFYDYIITYNLIFSNKKIIYYLEYIGSLVNFNDKLLNSSISIKIIKKFLLNKRCKYVFTWSKSAKKMLLEALGIPENKIYKFQVLYPSILPKNFEKKEDGTLIRLFFVSSIWKKDKEFNFYMKGGKLILQAYKELKKKYNNIELIFVGYVPKEFKLNYGKISGIKFFLKLPHEKILKLYEISDIFIFPTYGDTFGFTFLEAMAHRLPIICINNNSAATELVINNNTGFIIETSQKYLAFPFSKYCPEWITKMVFYNNIKHETDVVGLKNLIEKLEILINNKFLREKFGKNGRERLITGDLSIDYRNKKLRSLFKE